MKIKTIFLTIISILSFNAMASLTPVKLAGDYTIDILIGENRFLDKLKLSATPELSGTYIVQGAFTSKLDNISITENSLKFTIHVIEGSANYHSEFILNFQPDGKIIGEAVILPQRKLLGKFIAQRELHESNL